MAVMAAGFSYKHHMSACVCVCMFFYGILNGHLCHSHTHTHEHSRTLMTFSWPPVDECKKCGQIMEGSGVYIPCQLSLLTKWFVNILRVISCSQCQWLKSPQWHLSIFAFNRLKSCMHQHFFNSSTPCSGIVRGYSWKLACGRMLPPG